MPIPEKIIIPASKDPGKGHFYVSMVKSIVRMIAAGALMMGGYYLGPSDWGFWIMIAGAGLMFAEALGVVEEIV
jgi:hypothetical protein